MINYLIVDVDGQVMVDKYDRLSLIKPISLFSFVSNSESEFWGINTAYNNNVPLTVSITGAVTNSFTMTGGYEESSYLDWTGISGLKYITVSSSENNLSILTLVEGTVVVSIDLSNLTNLVELSVIQNPLTSLDISNNTELTLITIVGNYITGETLTSLDISNNTKLVNFRIDNNSFTGTDIENIIDQLISFGLTGNSFATNNQIPYACVSYSYYNLIDNWVTGEVSVDICPTTTTTTTAAVPTDPVALWHLENVNDSSGNGYNFFGTTTVTFAAGYINNCASDISPSSNKFLAIWNGLGITNGSISVCLWVYPNSATANSYEPYFSKWNNTYKIDYRIGRDGNDFFVARIQPGSVSIVRIDEIKTSYILTGWTHLAMVYDAPNSGLTMYKNGSLVDSISIQSGTGTANFSSPAIYTYLGNSSTYPPSNVFSAKIDECYVFNRVLSGGEVSAIYNIT